MERRRDGDIELAIGHFRSAVYTRRPGLQDVAHSTNKGEGTVRKFIIASLESVKSENHRPAELLPVSAGTDTVVHAATFSPRKS